MTEYVGCLVQYPECVADILNYKMLALIYLRVIYKDCEAFINLCRNLVHNLALS